MDTLKWSLTLSLGKRHPIILQHTSLINPIPPSKRVHRMLDQEAFTNITALLLPHTHDLAPRRALVERALFNCRVLNGIIWEGDAQTFTVTLIKRLHDFGECAPNRPALVMLLETLKEDIGANHHARIDNLISDLLTAPLNPTVNPVQIAKETDKKSSQPNIVIKLLRDPAFQAITAVIGILLAIVAIVLPLTQSNKNETPISPLAVVTTATPIISRGTYPCDGEVISTIGGLLNQVRLTPNRNSQMIEPIQQGSKVSITDRKYIDQMNWYKISYGNNQTGWIPVDYVSASSMCPS